MTVYINLASYTKFGEHFGQDIFNLAEQLVNDLIQQGLDLKKIEALVIGNMLAQTLDHQSQLGAVIAHRLGLSIPAIRVESACASGGSAVFTGASLIQTGRFNNVLVIGAEKMTDHPTDKIAQTLSTAGYACTEPAFFIPFPATYALYANHWLNQKLIKPKTLFYIGAKNHRHALSNPKAQFSAPLTYQTYQSSTPVAHPLKLFDCSPITDGAAGLWLASKPHQKSIKLINQVLTSGPTSPHHNPKLNGLPAAKKAADLLFNQSGITPGDIDIAEVHDCFTIAEAMAVTDLGLIKQKDLNSFYQHYFTHHKPPKNRPFINTSGGLKACGHPIGATGVKQVAEIYLQLTGQAGPRQIAAPRIGLTHNVGGSGGTVYLSLWQTNL
ncbi:MAG: thiolase domain-containing protein [bacterium]|nr:thiolase domain-containing protein [bacterium]